MTTVSDDPSAERDADQWELSPDVEAVLAEMRSLAEPRRRREPMTPHDRRNLWLVAIVAVAITAAQLGYYWNDADKAPVRACESLGSDEVIADCLDGL